MIPQTSFTIYTDKAKYMKVGTWVVLNPDDFTEDAMVTTVSIPAGSITIVSSRLKHYTQEQIDKFPLIVKRNK